MAAIVEAVASNLSLAVTGFASFVIEPTLRPTLGEHRRAPLVSDGLDLTRIECHV